MNTTRVETTSSTCSHATDSTRRDARDASSVDFTEPAGALTSTSGTLVSMPPSNISSKCGRWTRRVGNAVGRSFVAAIPTSRIEIVIEGRATAGLSRPLLDDFSFDRSDLGVTRSTGETRDEGQRHGVMAHFTAVGVELTSVAPVAQFNQPSLTTRPERNET